jgi:multiple sugar transport system ATP-binding protein
VTNVEYTGRQNVVTVVMDAPLVTVPDPEAVPSISTGAMLRSLFPARAEVRPGQSVRLAVEAARAHVFDAVTGEALWHPEPAR